MVFIVVCSYLFLASLATAAPVDSAPVGQRSDTWSAGDASWEAARQASGDKLWDEPNSCDPTVLRSSAPLTVLYSLSNIWKRVQDSRRAEGRTNEPLEVHVLGAAYPFEGRSDWSVLAKHRPTEIPKVRVTLVLGTPFQSDNVPPLNGQPNNLMEVNAKITPGNSAGKWSNNEEEILCKGSGKWGTEEVDKNWSKEDLCRDHGNGVEVVCLEKFYQDVRDNMTKPDLAVMFSPGFPQMSRRSWDTVLIGLLNTKVPIMISDVSTLPQSRWGHEVTPAFDGAVPVPPGGLWRPAKSEYFGEDWQTWLTMSKYKAQLVRARRGPFPILHLESGEVLAKNAVIQIYEGYMPEAKQVTQPSEAEAQKYHKMFSAIDWKRGGKCRELAETQRGFASPTSKSFDSAMRRMYKSDLKSRASKKATSLTKKQRASLQKYGLIARDNGKFKSKRWNVKAVVNMQRLLGCIDF